MSSSRSGAGCHSSWTCTPWLDRATSSVSFIRRHRSSATAICAASLSARSRSMNASKIAGTPRRAAPVAWQGVRPPRAPRPPRAAGPCAPVTVTVRMSADRCATMSWLPASAACSDCRLPSTASSLTRVARRRGEGRVRLVEVVRQRRADRRRPHAVRGERLAEPLPRIRFLLGQLVEARVAGCRSASATCRPAPARRSPAAARRAAAAARRPARPRPRRGRVPAARPRRRSSAPAPRSRPTRSRSPGTPAPRRRPPRPARRRPCGGWSRPWPACRPRPRSAGSAR